MLACVAGIVEFDDDGKVAHVRGFNPPVILEKGDVVICEVVQVMKQMALTRVLGYENGSREPGGDTEGPIHVSNIAKRFCDDAREFYKAGDIVRAKVIKATPALQLETKDGNLGVLKARCCECRRTLVPSGEMLYCGDCERVEKRNLASDFKKFTPERVNNPWDH